jgi:septal ring factor EnvC (AmiA/AmiB activator)
MQVVVKSLFALCLLSSTAWAVEPTAPAAPAPAATAQPQATAATTAANTTATKPLTAEQIAKAKQQQDAKVKAMIQDQASRLKQLEHANLEALSQNQELQLKNDNLTVQVQVLQSERSAQMFLYGAMTIAVGVILGFLIASYIHTKRRRQW